MHLLYLLYVKWWKTDGFDLFVFSLKKKNKSDIEVIDCALESDADDCDIYTESSELLGLSPK